MDEDVGVGNDAVLVNDSNDANRDDSIIKTDRDNDADGDGG